MYSDWVRPLDDSPVSRELESAFVKLDVQQIRETVKRALVSGIAATEIVKCMQAGMMEIGKKYEAGEYFLSELMAAGDILKVTMEQLTPSLGQRSNAATTGTIVLGTVQGDLHDIGKNLFKIIVQSLGFTVRDLGIDVPRERFVDEAKNPNADIVAMSALLTTSMDEMRLVVEELKRATLESKLKIIIGGNPISDEFGEAIGADAAVRDAVRGANLCKAWMMR